MKKGLKIILFIPLVSGCWWTIHDEDLRGGYILTAMDTREEMEISHWDSALKEAHRVISATVFAVGQDSNFIIAKQHPSIFPNYKNIDKTTVNYYIIPLKNKISESAEKNFFGPLTLEQFEQKKRELNINVEFTIVFKDLE